MLMTSVINVTTYIPNANDFSKHILSSFYRYQAFIRESHRLHFFLRKKKKENSSNVQTALEAR